VKVLLVFKAVLVSSGSVFLALLVLPGAVKSAVDRQRWVSFDTFFWPDIFYQHCLGLVHYNNKIIHNFTSPEVLPKPPKPRLFKATQPTKIRPVNALEKKYHCTGGCIGLMSRVPYSIYHQANIRDGGNIVLVALNICPKSACRKGCIRQADW